MKHSELGAKNLQKICPKIVQKALKWPLLYVSFQKFFVGACPRIPLEPFFFRNLLVINSAGKNTLKNCQILMPTLPEKNPECAPSLTRNVFKWA